MDIGGTEVGRGTAPTPVSTGGRLTWVMLKDIAINSTFVVFLILNIIQIVTIIVITIYVLIDIKRKSSPEMAVRSSPSFARGEVKYVNGATPKLVAMYRRDMKPKPVNAENGRATASSYTNSVLKREAAVGPRDVKKRNLLQMLRDGTGDSSKKKESIKNVLREIFSTVKDVETYRDKSKLSDEHMKIMEADPYIIYSCVLSKFASTYSPMHLRVTWSDVQLNNNLIYPNNSIPKEDTVLVLPTGHVINKARFMTTEDMKTLGLVGYTVECAKAPLASCISAPSLISYRLTRTPTSSTACTSP